jgi:hypothetical protein
MNSNEAARGASDEPSSRLFETLLWCAALALALLRFAALGRWGLWIDEAHTLHDAAEFSRGNTTAFPLGLSATWTAVLASGSTSEATLRFAPAVFGALGVLLCTWAFEPAVGRPRALACAVLVGLASWHLYWSQSARAYTLAQDIALLGGGLALHGCVRRSAWRYVLGLATAAIAAFAHPSAGLIAPVMIFAPLFAGIGGARLPWRPPVWVVALAGVALLAVLGGWGQSVWADYLERKAGANTLHLIKTCGWYFTPLVCASALVGAWLAWRRRLAVERFVVWLCVLVVAAVACASLVVVVSAQYIFVLLPWVALLATVPLFDASIARRWRIALASLLALYGIADLTLYFTLRHGDRPRWNEAYAWVFEHRGRDDLVFGMAWPAGEYYFAPGSTELRTPMHMARLSAFHANALAQWPRRGRREWFVVNHEDLLAWDRDDRERLLTLLATQCEQVATFPVPTTPRNLAVDVYVRE